jgi:hypothetical protein
MNQPDDELARKLVRYLNEGCRNLDQPMAERLLAARKAALSRYPGKTAPAWGWVTASQAIIGRPADQRRLGSVPMLIAAAALVAALIGVAYWQNYGNGQANELAEVDVGLLTDELPINAYLDRGFDSWLKRSSR